MKIEFVSFLFLLVLIMACNQNNSEEVFQATQEKLRDISALSYSYKKITDTKINETITSNTTEVVYHKVEESALGFALFAKSKDEESLFDGFNYEKVKHLSKKRVKFEKDKIASDSNYFQNQQFFSTSPFGINEYDEFRKVNDTILEGKLNHFYLHETQRQSKSDKSKLVKYQKYFFIDNSSKNVSQVQDLIIRNDETLRIVDHYFTNYKFNDKVRDSPTFDRFDKLEYLAVGEEDEFEEFIYTPIKEGEILTKQTFVDVNQKEVRIFGDDSKSSLIMFSFIGCTPCEVALRDFKSSGYPFTDKIEIFYSSFQNTSSSIKKYLETKDWPYKAFGKESSMIEEFSLYFSPTFVLLDSRGKIQRIIEGYDEEVKTILFEILKPK